MLIIAEKINIMSKTIGPAMRERNAKPVQELALAEVAGGARALDLNLGPGTKDGPAMMEWLVKTVEEVVEDSIQLCLDTKNIEAMEAGLKVVTKHKPMINSTNADIEVLDKYMPVAAMYDADIIALAMTSAGIPRDCNERLENAAMIMAKAMEHGVGLERIYLDPLVLPIGVAQQDAMEVVETIRQFQMLNDPPMKSVVGLSNIYNGTPKELHSRMGFTFLAMLAAAGLTAAIADSLDAKLMAVVKTVEVLKNEMLYAASYLDDILVRV
ncbi:MAG: dihydropteroate synthase [Actinobacteria bacterium]|nr:dihydropteroate synthase [Actinomycetota bacterium]